KVKSEKITFLRFISLTLAAYLVMMSVPLVLARQDDEKTVDSIARSGDQKILAITYSSGGLLSLTIELYDASTGQLIRTVDVSPIVPRRIALSPTGDRIVYAGTGGELGIFNINTSTNNIILNYGAVSIDVLAWNPSNNEIAYTLGSGVYILDATSATVIRNVNTGTIRVVEMAWSPDGQKLATSHYTEDVFNPGVTRVNVKIWNLTSEENPVTSPLLTIENRGGGNIDWSPDETRLALLEKNRLFIYDLSAGQSEVDLPFDEESPATLVWSPDGRFVATGGTTIRIWDTSTWQVIRTIPVTGAAGSLQWSPNSEHLFNDGGPSGLYLDDAPIKEIGKEY
ncbi:MAG TPA: hypothetical protein VHO69_05910, partial [Phototrophicaceae bacterium]|nr:hypothetical protein [Phototrophicaceae bacterium]